MTTYLDVRYTQGLRFISPLEQTLHGLLDMIPAVILAAAAFTHTDAALALVGFDADVTRFGLVFQTPPLSPTVLTVVLISGALLGVLPVLEEIGRGMRARRPCAARPPRGASALVLPPGRVR